MNTKNDALAALLEERLISWEKARKPQELKMLELYQDVMRIPRDDDTKGTGSAKSRNAKAIFIGSTRNKVRAARAKINDALFGSGRLPFDTNPTNESLKAYADAVEDIVSEQLEKMNFRQMMKSGVNTLAMYGTGFIFGPFVKEDSIKETYADNSAGFTELKETEHKYDCPYFELGNTLDCYPDPECRNIDDGLGLFWSTLESPHTVASWKADKRYQDIDAALQNKGTTATEGSALARELRGNQGFWFENDRIKVARFFGKVPRKVLSIKDENEAQDDNEEKGEDLVDIIAIMAGGVVVKVDESPYGGKNPAMRCVYEAVDHEIYGVGVAENNMPHQKVTNAGFRLFIEGKGMALLPPKSVDRSKFLSTEDFLTRPGKVYEMKPGLSPDERNSAIIDHVSPDVTGGWIDVIRMSESFSDDDTGITKYTQGDDSRNLNKTASGISMIMSASSLPIKEVIQNIDEMWIENIVERLINWNLKYLDVETVQKIHGDEIAKVWGEIKSFGKTSFMDWQATGTSSFMQKEVLASKIRAFSEFALSNPMTAQLIDARELLNQTWDVMEVGRESPILKEDGEQQLPEPVKQKISGYEQQLQQLDQQMHQASDAIEQRDEQLRLMQMKLDQVVTNNNKLSIELEKERALKEIEDAQSVNNDEEIKAAATVRVAEIDAAKELAIATMASPKSEEEGVNQLDEVISNFQSMSQIIAENTVATQALAARVAQPKVSQVKVIKQPDGSYEGIKTEEQPI
jgi:hypothetical protein